jgi:beta-1,2-mannobiose phosphorylase / 1,2-beta-oligomannan phosphorylase
MRPPPYRPDRIGVVMEPLPGDPQEVEGVLNPATARNRDGELYLFPRLVARGNFSRIGRAGVQFDSGGKASGVEDPRITFIDSLNTYVMAYALPMLPRGVRSALPYLSVR